MRRRTKIVATLGPATDKPDIMSAMIQAGMNVARVNFSHGSAADIERRVALVRDTASALGRDVGLLGDLQGPKIRIERFRHGPVKLEIGADFVLDTELDDDAGDQGRVGVTYKALPSDVDAGDLLLLDDGQIALRVVRVNGSAVHCHVEQGGVLKDSKGINRQGGGLSARALTDKDREDIKTTARLGLDYLAVSFPRSAEDIDEARALLEAAGGHARIVAKIERAEAVDNLASVVRSADVVMVARGDLGVEIGDAELPGVQKHIISTARDHNRVVITATQMMESMISSPLPTRAEVLDVANAVMDGTDAVMLSAESAVGDYPVKTVEAMSRVCLGAERHRSTTRSHHRIDAHFELVDEAIAMASMYTANHLNIKAIVALTESGSTALWMSRIRSGKPIFALTRHESTRRRVTLYRGVYPVHFDVTHTEPELRIGKIVQAMKDRNEIQDGDRVIYTTGEHSGVAGGTNTMMILTV